MVLHPICVPDYITRTINICHLKLQVVRHHIIRRVITQDNFIYCCEYLDEKPKTVMDTYILSFSRIARFIEVVLVK